MNYAHSFYGDPHLAMSTPDANYFSLWGLNMLVPEVKNRVEIGYAENVINHDFHSYNQPIRQYKRELFGATAEKVSFKSVNILNFNNLK